MFLNLKAFEGVIRVGLCGQIQLHITRLMDGALAFTY